MTAVARVIKTAVARNVDVVGNIDVVVGEVDVVVGVVYTVVV